MLVLSRTVNIATENIKLNKTYVKKKIEIFK
jgi:hypothetical protein